LTRYPESAFHAVRAGRARAVYAHPPCLRVERHPALADRSCIRARLWMLPDPDAAYEAAPAAISTLWIARPWPRRLRRSPLSCCTRRSGLWIPADVFASQSLRTRAWALNASILRKAPHVALTRLCWDDSATVAHDLHLVSCAASLRRVGLLTWGLYSRMVWDTVAHSSGAHSVAHSTAVRTDLGRNRPQQQL
jgi:hypothetical protein